MRNASHHGVRELLDPSAQCVRERATRWYQVREKIIRCRQRFQKLLQSICNYFRSSTGVKNAHMLYHDPICKGVTACIAIVANTS
jgi:hypothetical protein